MIFLIFLQVRPSTVRFDAFVFTRCSLASSLEQPTVLCPEHIFFQVSAPCILSHCVSRWLSYIWVQLDTKALSILTRFSRESVDKRAGQSGVQEQRLYHIIQVCRRPHYLSSVKYTHSMMVPQQRNCPMTHFSEFTPSQGDPLLYIIKIALTYPFLLFNLCYVLHKRCPGCNERLCLKKI